jgi:hypothetical protein
MAGEEKKYFLKYHKIWRQCNYDTGTCVPVQVSIPVGLLAKQFR